MGETRFTAMRDATREDYQIIGTTRRHFDDREEAEQALREWAPR